MDGLRIEWVLIYQLRDSSSSFSSLDNEAVAEIYAILGVQCSRKNMVEERGFFFSSFVINVM